MKKNLVISFQDKVFYAQAVRIHMYRLCPKLGILSTLSHYISKIACQAIIISGLFLVQESSLRAMEVEEDDLMRWAHPLGKINDENLRDYARNKVGLPLQYPTEFYQDTRHPLRDLSPMIQNLRTLDVGPDVSGCQKREAPLQVSPKFYEQAPGAPNPKKRKLNDKATGELSNKRGKFVPSATSDETAPLDHPLTQSLWQNRGLSPRLQNISRDIEHWEKELLSGNKDSITFDKNDLEKYQKLLAISSNDKKPVPGLSTVKFEHLLINHQNSKNVNSGNTGAEVTVLSSDDGKIAIKKFKNFEIGLKELFSYRIALRHNPSGSKMTWIYDAVFIPESGLSIIMEGAETHDIYHFLDTDLAETALKAVAHFLAEFHIESHKDLLKNPINKEKYIQHLAKALHTAYDPLNKKQEEMGLYSFPTESFVEGDNFIPQEVNAQKFYHLLPQDMREIYKALAKNTFQSFHDNAGEIWRSLSSDQQTMYPVARAHGDAHGGNFFYYLGKLLQNGFEVPEDSFLRIAMIDFPTMVRTLCGGNLEEDIARFLGSIWVHALQKSELSECYEKISTWQNQFLKNYLEKIINSGIVAKQYIEKFKKIFKENVNFYKLRYYKVVFNLPNDKMDNKTKLRVLKTWMTENAQEILSLFQKSTQSGVVCWLPEKQEGLIESFDKGDAQSNLTLLKKTLQDGILVPEIPIVGMGGMGKTSLALQVAYKALEEKLYDAIFWVWSDTKSSLVKGYKKILSALGIPSEGLRDDEIIELVKEHLPKFRKCLVIYDDVLDPGFLEGKVPQGIHRLYTSRCKEGWEQPPFELKVWRPDDAIAYLFNITGLEINHESEKRAEKLAKELGYFPLALAHAAHYMKLTGMGFEQYFEIWKNPSSYHFKDHQDPFKKLEVTYENLVRRTLEISKQKVSPLAREFLVYCAYLSPEDISKEVFLRSTATKQEVEEAFAQLSAFSLINKMSTDSLSIHRLVQLLIRNEEEAKSKDQTAFSNLVLIFNRLFIKDTFSYQNIDALINHFPHLLTLLEHSERLKHRLQNIDHLLHYLKWVGRILYVIEQNSIKSEFRNLKNYKQIDKASEILFNDSLKNQSIPDWLRLNAANADPKVQFALGFMYDNSYFVEGNYEEACFWYETAAKEGDIDAQFFLGRLHDIGQKHQDDEIAIKWFNKAAKQGDRNAQKYIISYAKIGDPKALFYLGKMYFTAQRHHKAIKCFAGAASEGDKRARDYLFEYAGSGYKEAYYSMGQVYVAQGNDAEAIKWFFKASKEGHKRAQSALHLYARGGHAEAQFNLGWLYVNGFMEKVDNKNGRKWFVKAARQNHSEAQLALCILDTLTGQIELAHK